MGIVEKIYQAEQICCLGIRFRASAHACRFLYEEGRETATSRDYLKPEVLKRRSRKP